MAPFGIKYFLKQYLLDEGYYTEKSCDSKQYIRAKSETRGEEKRKPVRNEAATQETQTGGYQQAQYLVGFHVTVTERFIFIFLFVDSPVYSLPVGQEEFSPRRLYFYTDWSEELGRTTEQYHAANKESEEENKGKNRQNTLEHLAYGQL